MARDLSSRGLVIKAFDCYRPTRAVANFVRWARDLKDQKMKAEFYPDVDKRTLFRDGYIATQSGHSRGSTIDLTLAEADGHELDMGTPFDFFSPKSWTADPSVGAEAHNNRILLASRDAPAWLPRLRQGMVALHAARRAVPGHVFQFCREVNWPYHL